jgi:hypothetical protein
MKFQTTKKGPPFGEPFQTALEAAILDLSNWVERRGSADVADNVRGAPKAIDRNEEFIKMTLAVMMAPQ